MNPDGIPKRGQCGPLPQQATDPRHFTRSGFLGHLGMWAEETASVNLTIWKNGDKLMVTIRDCAPAILRRVMDLVTEGKIESYEVGISNGGLTLGFGDLIDD